MKYPALLLLPMFSYFTFGPLEPGQSSEVGLILSWKWTVVNIFISLFWFIGRAIFIQFPQWQDVSLCRWIAYDPPSPTNHSEPFFISVCLFLYLSILLTLLLPLVADLQYGVLIPCQHSTQYVLQEGQVTPLLRPSPPADSLEMVVHRVPWLLASVLCLVIVIFLFTYLHLYISIIFTYQDYINSEAYILGDKYIGFGKWEQCYH